MRNFVIGAAVTAAFVFLACTSQSTPSGPSQPAGAVQLKASLDQPDDSPSHHNSAAHDDKGYIDGWYNGQAVQLYYTKTYYCQEPPDSAAPSGCEIGADALTPPRPGPIPTIYAIAAAGIQVDPATLACRLGTTCLNHPAMIDASRVLGPGASNIPGVPHSHIVVEKTGGWFHTVNIRVRDVGRWNQIAAAMSLDKVRELQADGSGLVSPDTPTNVYFFIASWRE
jgi:hypothetical protein